MIQSLCSRCRRLKDATEFTRCDLKRNGLSSHCKECQRERATGMSYAYYQPPEYQQWIRRR